MSVFSPGARMLLGIAVGDAYGARFENMTADKAQELLAAEGISPTAYSDDTQQSIAVVELMVSSRTLSPVSLAEAFLSVYRRDPRQGYSKVTRSMLESSLDGEAFLISLPLSVREIRKTDGAAMRAVPIGFYPDYDDVIRYSLMSAGITHGHPDALAATVAVAAIAHMRYHTKTPFEGIWPRIRQEVIEINPGCSEYLDACAGLSGLNRDLILGSYEEYGVPYTESRVLLGAVLTLLTLYGDDPERLLLEAILLGGDTDTVAALVVGIAVIEYTMTASFIRLITALEDGDYGRRFLLALGDRLSEKFPSSVRV